MYRPLFCQQFCAHGGFPGASRSRRVWTCRNCFRQIASVYLGFMSSCCVGDTFLLLCVCARQESRLVVGSSTVFLVHWLLEQTHNLLSAVGYETEHSAQGETLRPQPLYCNNKWVSPENQGRLALCFVEQFSSSGREAQCFADLQSVNKEYRPVPSRLLQRSSCISWNPSPQNLYFTTVLFQELAISNGNQYRNAGCQWSSGKLFFKKNGSWTDSSYLRLPGRLCLLHFPS